MSHPGLTCGKVIGCIVTLYLPKAGHRYSRPVRCVKVFLIEVKVDDLILDGWRDTVYFVVNSGGSGFVTELGIFMAVREFNGIFPKVDGTTYVDDMALLVGDVTVGAESSIWPMTVVRGDVQRIEIGHHTNVQDGSVLHVTTDNRFTPGGFPLKIGNYVTVGHGVILHACTVGDHCLIGMGSTVLDGAVIEDRVMLGAGSLVTSGKVLTSGQLWIGRPAKPIRALTQDELDYLEYSAEHYRELKNKHMS